MKTFYILFFTLSLILCGTSLQAQTTKPPVDGDWKIKSLKDSGKMIDLSAKETEVTINTKSKNIAVYIGCNHISSPFEFITADKIKPFVLTATRKSCSSLQDLESALIYVLEQTNSVRKNGAKTEFYKDNDLLMVLERVVDNGKKKKH